MATTEKPVIAKYKDRMEKAVDALQDEFGSLRTGRASVGLLDQLRVDAYGSSVPINQVGAISVPEPRMITVSVWDRAPGGVRGKGDPRLGPGPQPRGRRHHPAHADPAAHRGAPQGPCQAGRQIRRTAGVAIRNVRRDANDDLRKAQKDAVISQDEEKRMETEVQKITDEAIKRVDEALKTKEQEIMHV